MPRKPWPAMALRQQRCHCHVNGDRESGPPYSAAVVSVSLPAATAAPPRSTTTPTRVHPQQNRFCILLHSGSTAAGCKGGCMLIASVRREHRASKKRREACLQRAPPECAGPVSSVAAPGAPAPVGNLRPMKVAVRLGPGAGRSGGTRRDARQRDAFLGIAGAAGNRPA